MIKRFCDCCGEVITMDTCTISFKAYQEDLTLEVCLDCFRKLQEVVFKSIESPDAIKWLKGFRRYKDMFNGTEIKEN